MSFNAKSRQPSRDDEPCPLPQNVDPQLEWLDSQMWAIFGMDEQTGTTSVTMGFSGPEEAARPATQPGDIQLERSSPFPYLPPPPPSESLPHHFIGPPYPDFLPQAQEDPSEDVLDNSFFPAPPIAPIQSWTGFSDSDGALCSSPTHLQELLALPDVPPDVEHWDGTGLSTPPSSRSSTTYRMCFGEAVGDSNTTREVSQSAKGPYVPDRIITVLPQLRYQKRQSSWILGAVPPQVISFLPYGYPFSSVRKGKKLVDLPNRNRHAFPDVLVGQKLSWRFLFDGCVEFNKQYNVMGATKTQPTVERIMVETRKALVRFMSKERRFTYPLDRLVVLEIELVSCASVQAKIGIVEDVGLAHRG